jgi:pilus assembly protein TadC
MFALPRYALLRWFLIRPDYLDRMIGSQNITEMMRSDSFALELSALGTDEIAALEYVIIERGQESIMEDDEKVAKVYITVCMHLGFLTILPFSWLAWLILCREQRS